MPSLSLSSLLVIVDEVPIQLETLIIIFFPAITILLSLIFIVSAFYNTSENISTAAFEYLGLHVEVVLFAGAVPGYDL